MLSGDREPPLREVSLYEIITYKYFITGVLIRKKSGNIFDVILRKTCIFSSIYIDWSEGLLDSRGKSE
jgi:hypothetical protein